MRHFRRWANRSFTAVILAAAVLIAGGCGLSLPFDLPFGSDEAANAAADPAVAGIDDGAADDSDAAGAQMTGARTSGGQSNGAQTSGARSSRGQSDSGLSSGEAEAGGEKEADPGWYALNACDDIFGTRPLLSDDGAVTVYVRVANANVREKPGTDSRILGVVRRGMSLLRYDEEDGWSLVRYGGMRAYVSSDLLTESYPHFVSSHDQDGDGVDDQTEILANARAYVATRPIYDSRYYDSGYPDDGYGVCSDVVAFAMRDAGYDLRALLDADIKADPAAYGIKEPDSKIDFRRVVNLEVYFSRHFIPKTTDLTQLEEWQGGDIIFFDHHIAVVSDRRNADGIPYIIHHRSKLQYAYEEDYLPIRHDVTGHYRVSE